MNTIGVGVEEDAEGVYIGVELGFRIEKNNI